MRPRSGLRFSPPGAGGTGVEHSSPRARPATTPRRHARDSRTARRLPAHKSQQSVRRAEIQRGEVAPGMGYREVLAAWDKPDARVASADP